MGKKTEIADPFAGGVIPDPSAHKWPGVDIPEPIVVHCLVGDLTKCGIGELRQRAEKAEAALDEAIKQVATMSEEMGKIEADCEKLSEALQALYDAEWMVSHDWGGDRDSVMEKVHAALDIAPETDEPLAEPAKEEGNK